MGSKHHKGLPDRLPVQTLSKGDTSHSSVLSGAKSINRGGGKGTYRQRSHIRSPQPSGRVLFQPVPGPKEGRRSETSDKPKSPEQLCSDSALQNGGNPYDLVNPKDWLAKVDLKDAYFAIPIHQSRHQYLRFRFQGKCYQFQCLPFGLSSAPWVFTKTLKPALALLREMGVRLIAYIDDILILAESRELARSHAEGLVYLLQCLGFKINQKKICTRASPSDGIPGANCGHSSAGAETPTRENKEDSCGVTSNDEDRACLRQRPSSSGGEDDCNISGDPTSPTIFPPSTDGTGKYIKHPLPVLRGTGLPYPGMQGGIDVVGHPHDKLEWEVPPQEGSGHDNRLR